MIKKFLFKSELAPVYWMILAMALFVSMDTCGKFLFKTQSLIQIVWGRYFFHFTILFVLLSPRLKYLLETQNLKVQLIRSILLLASTLCFFGGLQYIQLAQASSIMLVSPLLVTALSVPLLREKVGIKRWASILIGLIGALFIIRPSLNFFNSGASLTFCAAIFFALYQISTRFLSKLDNVLTTLFYSSSVGAIILSIFVSFFWEPVNISSWILMIMMGSLGGIGHFALIKAFSGAQASVITPFTYSNVLWATLFGFIFFNKLPDFMTVIGAIIIIASGLYLLKREKVLN